MKLRTDFVTNSSSSSFVVAYKNKLDIDEETERKYPFIQEFYNNVIEEFINSDDGYETETGEIISSKNELDEWLDDRYNYDGYYKSIEEIIKEEVEEDVYKECIKAIDDGYLIVVKEIGYGDESLVRMLEKCKAIKIIREYS